MGHGHALPDDFDAMAWCYDWVWVPTHPRRLAPLVAGVAGPVLDLGGGTGRFSARIFDASRQRVLVVDPAARMLQRARRKRRPVSPVQGSGVALPLPDASLGAVVATEAFHHFGADQAAVVAEVARVLRPDGRFVVEEPDPSRGAGRLMAWLERRHGMSSAFLPPAALKAMLAPRFWAVTHRRTGRLTYAVVAERPSPAPR